MGSERIAAKRRAYVKESLGVQARRDQGGKERNLCALRAEVYSSARIIWGKRVGSGWQACPGWALHSAALRPSLKGSALLLAGLVPEPTS